MSVVEPGRALLSVQNVVMSYGGQPVLRDVSFTLHAGDRIGLIGRNGSGKSTLLRLLSGRDTPDSGLLTRSQGLRVSFLAQQCDLSPDLRVGEALEEAAADLRGFLAAYHDAMERMAATPPGRRKHDELHEECDRLHHVLDATDAWNLDQEVKRVSVALDLPEPDRLLSSLSGGELRRVDLASRLIQRPDVLLLDEPTNHIDTRSVEWIEAFLERYSGSCVLVTHDRYFLDRVVNRIVELEFTRLYSFPGSYERFLEYKAGIEESVARAEDNRRALIRRELAWLRRGPKARGTKAKARVKRAHEIIGQDAPPRHREFAFEIPEPQRLGKIILEAKHITHGFGERVLFKDFSLLMQAEMRVGILGPNGSGKTTLLRVLMGQEEPKRGKIILGESTRFLYVAQSHEDMPLHQSVLKFVSDGAHYLDVNGRRLYVPGYLERFLFDKATVEMPIGQLSGGERNRLDLLKKLLQGGNFLILDEPTNDLDLYTLRVLEETIDQFSGCALIVSHDRYFLNRVCTHILVFEDEGRIVQIAGNYEDYLLYKAHRDAEKAKSAPPRQKAAESPKSTEGKSRKLTLKEKYELEAIEGEIAEAEERVSELETALLKPDFYEQEYLAVQEHLKNLEGAREKVAALYARWEELEMIRTQGGA